MLECSHKAIDEIIEDFRIWVERYTEFVHEMLEIPPEVNSRYNCYDRGGDFAVHIAPQRALLTVSETMNAIQWAKNLLKTSEAKVYVWSDMEITVVVRGDREDSYGAYIVDLWLHNAAKPPGSEVVATQETETSYKLIDSNEVRTT